MFILLIQILLVNSFDFDHPQIPTTFRWGLLAECDQHCQLNVTNKNTHEKVNFSPNMEYLSCDYTDDYQWQIDCDGDRYCESYAGFEAYLYTYPQKTFYATKTPQEDEKDGIGLLVIRIPQCEQLKDNDCLIVEISRESYNQKDKPFVLRYYGRNQFNCSHNYTSDPRFLVPYKTIKNSYGGYTYTAQFKLNCYSEQYYNIDPIAFEDEYYFQINSREYNPAKIRYYIGNDNLPTSPKTPSITPSISKMDLFHILFWVLCGLCTFLMVGWIFLYLYFTRYKTYSQTIPLDNCLIEIQENNQTDLRIELQENNQTDETYF